MSYIISEPRFSLERRVPITVILAVVLQFGAGLVWAAQLDTRVARIERDVERIGDRVEALLMKRNP